MMMLTRLMRLVLDVPVVAGGPRRAYDPAAYVPIHVLRVAVRDRYRVRASVRVRIRAHDLRRRRSRHTLAAAA